jgi:hypothetical protein
VGGICCAGAGRLGLVPLANRKRVVMSAFVADFLVSILPTFVVSRLLLWITKGWSDSPIRLVAVHCASLGLCMAAGTWGFVGSATDHPIVIALALFTPGELLWLLIDIFRLILRRRRTGR